MYRLYATEEKTCHNSCSGGIAIAVNPNSVGFDEQSILTQQALQSVDLLWGYGVKDSIWGFGHPEQLRPQERNERKMKIGEVELTFVHGDILDHLDWLESIDASLVRRRKLLTKCLEKNPYLIKKFSESSTKVGCQSDLKSQMVRYRIQSRVNQVDDGFVRY